MEKGKKDIKKHVRRKLLQYVNREENKDFGENIAQNGNSSLHLIKTPALTKLITKPKRKTNTTNQRKNQKLLYLKNDAHFTEGKAKEVWEKYRMEFQKSYDQVSQDYYDALDSPSKIEEMYGVLSSSSDEDEKKTDNFSLLDSSGDEMVPPSQHDFEIIKFRKPRQLLKEIYHSELESKLKEAKYDSNADKNEAAVRPLTLSQVCGSACESSAKVDNSIIIFSDDEDIVVEKIEDPSLIRISSTDSSVDNLDAVNSEDDSECIILPDSQVPVALPSAETFFGVEEQIGTDRMDLALKSGTDSVDLELQRGTDSGDLNLQSEQEKKQAKQKKALPAASELNRRLKNMGIKVSNKDLIDNIESSPLLKKLTNYNLTMKPGSATEEKNRLLQIKQSLIEALDFSYSADFLHLLDQIIIDSKNDESAMMKMLEKAETRSFFLNISIANSWSYPNFKEVLIKVIEGIICCLKRPQHEQDIIMGALLLIDDDILKEWCEDDLGICFEMKR